MRTEEKKILQLPTNMLLKEGAAQCDRVVEEVMEALFKRLPDNVTKRHNFNLASGTKCWIKKFHPPKKDAGGNWVYGFDVKFEKGYPLAHLEFSVNCSGWERVLSAPTTK